MSDSKVMPAPTPAAPTQVSGGDQNSIVWKHYIQLTRVHLWPLGSDTFWFAMSESSTANTIITAHIVTERRTVVWALLMTACRSGLSPQTVGVDALVLAVASTFGHNASCIWNDICDRDIDGRVGTYTPIPTPPSLTSK